MTTEWPLNDHWMTTEWPLNDHWMTTEWPLNDHWMTIEWPSFVKTSEGRAIEWQLNDNRMTIEWQWILTNKVSQFRIRGQTGRKAVKTATEGSKTTY